MFAYFYGAHSFSVPRNKKCLMALICRVTSTLFCTSVNYSIAYNNYETANGQKIYRNQLCHFYSHLL